MKIKTICLLYLVFYALTACDDNFLQEMEIPMEEEIEAAQYPKKYVYTGVEFNPTEFFRYQVDSFEQFVPEEGELLLADSVIEYEYNGEDALFIFPLKEMEFLSDTLVRIKIEGEDYLPIDSNFRYSIENEILLLDFFGGFVPFEIEEGQEKLKNCFQAFAYNHYSEWRERRHLTGLTGEPCSSQQKEEILNLIIENESAFTTFQLNDTILLNISHYVLELEE